MNSFEKGSTIKKAGRSDLVGWTAEMPQNLIDIRNKLIYETEFKAARLDLYNVSKFVLQKNLKDTPYVFTDFTNHQIVQDIVHNAGYKLDSDAGQYIPELDLIILHRDYNLEEINGNIFTEGLLVHELAHATIKNNLYLYENDDDIAHKFSTGFAITRADTKAGKKHTGFFLEEGFADMMRGEYISQNINQRNWNFDNDNNSNKLITFSLVQNSHNLSQVTLPNKYLHLNLNRKLDFYPSVPAGYAIEQLTSNIVGFEVKLLSSRFSTVGMREIIKLLNSVNPSLYTDLRNIPCDDTIDFIKGLNIVESRLKQMDNSEI